MLARVVDKTFAREQIVCVTIGDEWIVKDEWIAKDGADDERKKNEEDEDKPRREFQVGAIRGLAD